MKRLLTVLLLIVTASVQAQIVKDFHNVPLTDALRTIEQSQSEYTVSMLSDKLSELRVSVKVENLSVLDAVKLVCKNQPVKVKTRGNDIAVQYNFNADKRKIFLRGKVINSVTHLDLPHAAVRLYDADGKFIDSCEAISHSQYGQGPVIEHSDFYFRVPARPANYVIKASYVGFKTAEMPYTLDNIYKREVVRKLPPGYLKRESKILNEVVVTATKIQFYYKSDTLVFNADAFELAEGSMLDALVRQLPGIELKEGGRIYHNGKYVNSLLLNGKEFFRGNNTIMLENLAAFTVKEIQIYDRYGGMSEFLGTKNEEDKEYVMDVRLKKEYSIGVIGNAEVGKATNDRWLARLFALRFTDHSRIAAYATANNLNGDNNPGESGGWNPMKLDGGGMMTQHKAGIDYNVEERDNLWSVNGNVQLTRIDLDRQTVTNRQNFLSNGDTYERIRQSHENKKLDINTYHNFTRNFKMWNIELSPSLNYSKFDNSTGSLFSAFYQNDSLINRNVERGIVKGHTIEGEMFVRSEFKFKHSPDWLLLDAYVKYNDSREERFQRQNIWYSDASQPSSNLNRFYRNHPDRSWKSYINSTYDYKFMESVSLQLNVSYSHDEQRKERSIYDIDTTYVFGELPSAREYQMNIDRGNSYVSNLTEDTYSIYPRMKFNFLNSETKNVRKKWFSQLGFPVIVSRRSLHYQRGDINTTVTRTSMPINIWDCFVQYRSLPKEGYAHKITLEYIAKTTQYDLLNLIDMCDNTDVMNKRIGNGNLHNAIKHEFSYNHKFGDIKRVRNSHSVGLSYSFIQNAIAMGYQYDRASGIRTWQADNVNGNWDAEAMYSLNAVVGKRHPLTISFMPNVKYVHSVDLIDNRKSVVNNMSVNNALTLSYKFGEHSLRFKNSMSLNDYTSDREDFTDMRPLILTNGLEGLFKLPWKLELNTDVTMYSRTGYVDDKLNSSKFVWNARVSRPFFKGRLIAILDGYDILGQLDNVTRTVNAQGRTETFVNVMPRYVLFHLRYLFNKHNKKK